MDRKLLRIGENYKSLTSFENIVDSWLDNARPKEFAYIHKEDDFDNICKDLSCLKDMSKNGAEMVVTIGYSKQIAFPMDFNIVQEKKGFLKLIREPGEATEKEYVRLRPKRLIANLNPLIERNCVLVASEGIESVLPENDFCAEHNEIYVPFEKSSLFEQYNLVYNVSKQNTPVLIFPRGSDFIERPKRDSILRKFWHIMQN